MRRTTPFPVWSRRRPGRRHPHVFGLVLLFALVPAVLPAPPSPLVLAAEAISLVVNGVAISADVPPVIVDGRTLVPLRVVSENLGALVYWDGLTRTVSITLGSTRVELQVGETRAVVDGRPVVLDCPARIIGGRAMVPIRFVGEALGAAVAWDGTRRQVTVVKPRGGLAVKSLAWQASDAVARFAVVLNGPADYRWATLERSEQYPDRVLIDVVGAELEVLPQTPVGIAGVQQVRCFRQDVSGSAVARVVFDTAEPVRFRIWATWDPSPPVERGDLPADLTQGQEAIVLEVQYKLTGLEFLREPGRERLVLRLNGPAAYRVWEITDPWRIVVDIDRATLSGALPRTPTAIGFAGVTQARVGQFQVDPDVARVVLDAERVTTYGVGREGHDIVIYLGGTACVTGVAYQRTGSMGQLTVEADRELTASLTRLEQPARLVVEVPSARLGGSLLSGGNLTVGDDLVQSVSYVQASPGASKVTLTLQLTGPVAATVRSGERGLTVWIARCSLAGKVIVVDPGHGGNDPGAMAGGLREAELTLIVGTRLAELLRAAGATVYLTRSTASENPDKYARAGLADSLGADAFVSVHFNANHRSSIAGTETYYYDNHPRSRSLAEAVQARVVAALGRPSRGVRWADFVVTREPRTPAALVEALYLTNADDLALIRDAAVLERIARAIADGVQDFFAGP